MFSRSNSASVSSRLGIAYLTVAGLTLATNALGFVREILVARSYGATTETDAFFSAFSIISLFSLLFLAGTVQGAFMPHYIALKHKDKTCSAECLLNLTLKYSLLTGAVFSVLLFIFADPIANVVFSGLPLEGRKTTSLAIRWLSPIPLLSSLGAVIQSVLHADRRFVFPALVPLATNALIIISIVSASHQLGIQALSLGFVLGAMMWVVLSLPVLARHLKRPRRAERADDFGMVQAAFLMLAAMVVLDQVSALVQRAILATLGPGLISALSYGSKLAGLPVGILVGTLAAVMFPRFVSKIVSGDRQETSRFLQHGILTTLGLIAPVTLVFAFQAPEVVRLVFGSGKFDETAIAATGSVLSIYALGMPMQALLIFLEKAYLAASRTKQVVVIGAFAGFVQIILTWIMTVSFGWLGVPLGTLVYAIVHLSMLLYFATRFLEVPWRSLLAGVIRIGIASAIASAGLMLPVGDGIVGLTTKAVMVTFCYGAVLYALGERTILETIRAPS